MKLSGRNQRRRENEKNLSIFNIEVEQCSPFMVFTTCRIYRNTEMNGVLGHLCAHVG